MDVDPGGRKTLAIPLQQFHNCRKICTMAQAGRGMEFPNWGRCKPELREAPGFRSLSRIGNPATSFGDY